MANWKTCKIHGDDKPGVWGCPECLRELREENTRLGDALKAANDQTEQFEREWYLRGDEIERLRTTMQQVLADAQAQDALPEWWPMMEAALMGPNS